MRSARTLFGIRTVAAPTWHPANNTMIAVTPTVTLADVIQTTFGNLGAIVDTWTGAFGGPDSFGFAGQGGHFRQNDSGTYALQEFTQSTPPDWVVLQSAITPTSSCALQSGRPSPSHGYHSITYVDGIGPYLMGRDGLWIGGLPQPPSCSNILQFNESTSTWADIGNVNSGDIASTWDSVSGDIYYVDGSPATQSFYSVNPTTGARTQRGFVGTAYNIETAICADPGRRIILLRSARTPVYRVLDLNNPNNTAITPSIPSFPIRNSNSAASLMFCDTLGSNGKFVLWNGGVNFYTLEPPTDPLSTSAAWNYELISVSAASTPTDPSTGWFTKMRYLRTSDLFVAQGGSGGSPDSAYYVTRLVDTDPFDQQGIQTLTNTSLNADYAELTTIPNGFGDAEFTFEIIIEPIETTSIGETVSQSGRLGNWANETDEPGDDGTGPGWWFRGNFLLDGHNNNDYSEGTFSLQIYNSGMVRWTFGDGSATIPNGELWGIQNSSGTNVLATEGGRHHIACVRRWSGGSSADLELWVDGVLQSTVTSDVRTNMATTYWDSWSGFPATESAWDIGSEHQAADNSINYADYKGIIRSMAFFGGAKSVAELQSNYANAVNAGHADYLDHFSFGEGSGSTTTSENGISMSLVNSPSTFWP